MERTPYRLDVKPDGNGIESPGWFRASADVRDRKDETMVMSRLCALDWVTVLYDHVVPTLLKADVRQFSCHCYVYVAFSDYFSLS